MRFKKGFGFPVIGLLPLKELVIGFFAGVAGENLPKKMSECTGIFRKHE